MATAHQNLVQTEGACGPSAFIILLNEYLGFHYSFHGTARIAKIWQSEQVESFCRTKSRISHDVIPRPGKHTGILGITGLLVKSWDAWRGARVQVLKW